jgi:hypothetical protein
VFIPTVHRHDEQMKVGEGRGGEQSAVPFLHQISSSFFSSDPWCLVSVCTPLLMWPELRGDKNTFVPAWTRIPALWPAAILHTDGAMSANIISSYCQIGYESVGLEVVAASIMSVFILWAITTR